MRWRITWKSCLGGLFLVWGIAVASPASAQQGIDCDLLLAIAFIVDFEEDIQPIFNQHCVSCHQPGGIGHDETGLDLRPGQSEAHLVNVPSAQDPEWILKQSARTGPSLLNIKINCNNPPVGVRMPKDMPPLSVMDQMLIISWEVPIADDDPDEPEPETGHPINFGMSGAWYDRETAGQGLTFNAVVDRDPPLFVALWFTYAGDPGGPEGQRWFYAEGNYQDGDHSVMLDVYLFTGGAFDARPPDPLGQVIGSAMLAFHSCTEATLSYDLALDGDDLQIAGGEIPLVRLTPDVMCEVLSDNEGD